MKALREEEALREAASAVRAGMRASRKAKSFAGDGRFLLEKEAKALRDRLHRELNEACARGAMLLVYYPVRDELPLLPLYERIMEEGFRLYFPVTGVRDLTFFGVRDLKEASFSPGAMGIPEPVDRSRPFERADYDAVINKGDSRDRAQIAAVAPGLVFGREGGRIGYGGGYYDRFFGRYPAIYKIGAAYEFQVTSEGPPQGEWDASMDCIITENGRYGHNGK